MSFPNETKVEQLRRLFEGREAIYVEKGALRVKVTDISADLAQRCISAEVEEIPATGFPVGSGGHTRPTSLSSRLSSQPVAWPIVPLSHD